MQEKLKTGSITVFLILGVGMTLASTSLLRPCRAQSLSKAHPLKATQPVPNVTGIPVDDDDAPAHWADPHYRSEAGKQLAGIVVFLTVAGVIAYRRRHMANIRSHSSHA